MTLNTVGAAITAVVGLSDGYGPTIYGILGDGYSGLPIYWTHLEPNAGYKIVERSGELLNLLWLEKKIKN